jgi:hypothetical protein
MALSYMSPKKCGGRGGCGVSSNEYISAHGAKINFGDLTPYLTYGVNPKNARNLITLGTAIFFRSAHAVWTAESIQRDSSLKYVQKCTANTYFEISL